MSATLFVLGVALAAQVAGGGGRYGTPPANVPATDFGGLFADESAAPPATSDKPVPTRGATSSTPSGGAAFSPSAQPQRPAAVTPPAPSAAASIYGNSSVAPVATSPTDQRSATEPAELMKVILTKPAGSQLPGTPIGLSEVVQSAGSRAEQTARIEVYWELCSATADYYLGFIEQQELTQLQRQQPAMSAALRQADTQLRSRVATAQRFARVAQLRLASLMGRPATANLPLPKDMPHSGEYVTKYAEKFGDGGPTEAAELHALLPLLHAEIEAAAEAVMRLEQQLDAIAANRGSELDALRALELLALKRRAFVHLTRDYNRQITRYTEIATPGRLATGRLVAMLILTDRASAVAQRTAEPNRTPPRDAPPRDATPPRRNVPPTFAPAKELPTSETIQPLGRQSL